LKNKYAFVGSTYGKLFERGKKKEGEKERDLIFN
jgi:hypothetical protein